MKPTGKQTLSSWVFFFLSSSFSPTTILTELGRPDSTDKNLEVCNSVVSPTNYIHLELLSQKSPARKKSSTNIKTLNFFKHLESPACLLLMASTLS